MNAMHVHANMKIEKCLQFHVKGGKPNSEL